ncbi:MAG TPA: serine/threonine-protein kinase, partial [Gemmataceae bacterium]|nr:serine/threonine-protein kinase [Gemmataceae bacterium]
GLMSALAATTPWWWDGRPPAPPGLTEYQSDAIQTRFADDKLHRLRRALVMNQFLLLDHLGEGGQGRVYRGRQLRPSREVAIKILTQDTEDRRKRFEQEARAMMQVRHPAVARCYLYERLRQENGEVTDDYLIALEYIDGTDLQRLVRREGPVPWRFAVWWVANLLEGLHHVHAGGFIHRDVKPENVMIVGPHPTEEGVDYEQTAAKLLDLGAAKPVGAETDNITRQGIFIGTPEYAPPEQWNQTDSLSPASDVYALGGTLFYALTGRSPYQKAVRDALAYLTSHMNDPVPNIREHNATVPAEVNDVFRKMMAKEPAERGGTLELAVELRALLDHVRTPRTKAKAREGSAEPRRSGPNPTPPAAPKPKPTTRRDDENGGGLLGLLERILLPADQRTATSDMSAGERLTVLIRRPMTIVLLLVFFGFILWCVF